MIFIGDVHGKWQEYLALIKKCNESIQLGDFGFGFPNYTRLPIDFGEHFFIRGNHDSPEECAKHNNYLGDYGWYKRNPYTHMADPNLFFVSGAWSIDSQWRTIGKTWWPNEEIAESEFEKICDLYESVINGPEIVVSHEAPECVLPHILGSHKDIVKTRTSRLLQSLFEIKQPMIWLFAHYHVNLDMKAEGTRFVCLPELETFRI